MMGAKRGAPKSGPARFGVGPLLQGCLVSRPSSNKLDLPTETLLLGVPFQDIDGKPTLLVDVQPLSVVRGEAVDGLDLLALAKIAIYLNPGSEKDPRTF